MRRPLLITSTTVGAPAIGTGIANALLAMIDTP